MTEENQEDFGPEPDKLSFENEEEKQEFIKQVEEVLSGQGSEQVTSEQNEEGKEGTKATEPELMIGLTPMGTVGVRVTDENGDSVSYFISDPTEAWELSGHLQSLATIMVQTRYAMAMQEQRMIEEMMKNRNLYVPGHGNIT